jgi:hypothetical protein
VIPVPTARPTDISEIIVIGAPVDEVFEGFADLDHWRCALPDVLATNVAYDDGYNQEFTMTVDRPTGPETVRGFRYTRRPGEIEVWQTTPPPGLAALRGVWSFRPVGPGTEVRARRTFTVADPGADTAAVAAKLRATLRTNLGHFKASLEPRP